MGLQRDQAFAETCSRCQSRRAGHQRIAVQSRRTGTTRNANQARLMALPTATRYGWPKNIVHWKGIQESILDVCATVPVHFVIADAIMAMEGNGPLNGTPRPLNRIVPADDPVAADATCARLMGLDPDKVTHIRVGAQFLGNCSPEHIRQLAEGLPPPETLFRMVPEFQYLQANNSPKGSVEIRQ